VSIKNQFNACLPSVQAAILALHPNDKDPPEHIKLLGGEVVRYWTGNQFGLEPGSGLCVTASRFNHDCLPNCGRYYVKDHGLMVISAGQTITAGDELTISYTAKIYTEGFERFQAYIMDAWGFESFRLGSNGRDRDAYKVSERMIGLFDELGVVPARKHRTYYDMFQMAILRRSTLDKAKECAQKSLENAGKQQRFH
jgi:hypothetical protein